MSQQPILISNPTSPDFQHQGCMLVEACPGTGKTTLIVHLAARWMAKEPSRRVILLTYTNAAANNALSRLVNLIPPKEGEDVLALVTRQVWCGTIHGFARLIIDALGSPDSQIGGLQVADELALERALELAMDKVLREDAKLAREATGVLWARCGQLERLPGPLDAVRLWQRERGVFFALRRVLSSLDVGRPFDATGSALHAFVFRLHQAYRAALRERALLSPDEIIAEASRLIKHHPRRLAAFAKQWSCILEDEAQDSTPEQVAMLAALARHIRNWLRVGDNNQSIMGTFTLAATRGLTKVKGVRFQAAHMPYSPRSHPKIIAAANALATWTRFEHPLVEVRKRGLSHRPRIMPLPEGGNPGDAPLHAHLPPLAVCHINSGRARNPAFDAVLQWLREVFRLAPECRAAVLVRTNRVGIQLAQHLFSLPESEVGDLLARLRFDLRTDVDLLHASRKLASVMRLARLTLNAADLDRAALACGLHVSGGRVLRALAGEADELTDDERQLLMIIDDVRFAANMFIEDFALYILNRYFDDSRHLFGPIYDALREYRRGQAYGGLDGALDLLNRWDGPLATGGGERYRDTAIKPGEAVVTTLHKSKGQEYDCVAIFPASESNFPTSAKGEEELSERMRRAISALSRAKDIADLEKAIEEDKIDELAEAMRLLYVGITRARLHVAFFVHPTAQRKTDEYHPDRISRALRGCLHFDTDNAKRSDAYTIYPCEARADLLEKTGDRHDLREQIIAHLRQKMEIKEVAEALGCSPAKVRYWAKRLKDEESRPSNSQALGML